jgi:NAD(P)-dependent dehydrogenase (short-subunit alcohol dehydrogenase family)
MQHNVQAHAVKADLIDPQKAATRIIRSVKNHFTRKIGQKPQLTINILINNAGVGGFCALEAVSVEQFHRTYTVNVNVLAPIMLTQSCLIYLTIDQVE